MSAWFNYAATLKILLLGLLIGAGLPALFAVGVRLQAAGTDITGGDGAVRKDPMLIALSWVIFGVVFAVVLLGVLFIARDFIAAKTGWYLLGATPM